MWKALRLALCVKARHCHGLFVFEKIVTPIVKQSPTAGSVCWRVPGV